MKWILLLNALYFLPNAMAQREPCSIRKDGGVVLSSCTNQRGERTLELSIQGKDPLFLRANFAVGEENGLFKSLVAESSHLKLEQQRALRHARAQWQFLTGAESSLLRFLTDFAPENFPLRDYKPGKFLPVRPTATFQSICDKISRYNIGYFSARGQWWKQKAMVGADGCNGRCGAGCGTDPDPYHERYTQECFNHDLCAGFTGDNMGDCEPSFWAAADGFLNAPSCR